MNSLSTPVRRLFIKSGISLFIASVYGCSTEPKKPTSIEVDVTGVDSVPKLIDAVKKAGGRWLPNSIPDADFIKEFARTFVMNARTAAENGFKIPAWVLEKLPARKVVLPILGVMIFTAYGIEFILPVATVVTAVLGSIALMTTAVLAAISAMVHSNSKV